MMPRSTIDASGPDPPPSSHTHTSQSTTCSHTHEREEKELRTEPSHRIYSTELTFDWNSTQRHRRNKSGTAVTSLSTHTHRLVCPNTRFKIYTSHKNTLLLHLSRHKATSAPPRHPRHWFLFLFFLFSRRVHSGL